MREQTHNENAETRYASCVDFRRIFEEDLHSLYQLSFFLTGDRQKAERCFVAGLEDCVQHSRVFSEWARAWAKRVIVSNAIRELQPRWSHSNLSARVPIIFFPHRQLSGSVGHFDTAAVLRLADFERFVFVLGVLEHYREHECALLLGCSASEVRDARTRAIEELASGGQAASSRYEDGKYGQLAAAGKS